MTNYDQNQKSQSGTPNRDQEGKFQEKRPGQSQQSQQQRDKSSTSGSSGSSSGNR